MSLPSSCLLVVNLVDSLSIVVHLLLYFSVIWWFNVDKPSFSLPVTRSHTNTHYAHEVQPFQYGIITITLLSGVAFSRQDGMTVIALWFRL